MDNARLLVELAHSKRKEAGIKVKQALALLDTYSISPITAEIMDIIAKEINVEKITNTKGELGIKLDTNITEGLRQKGEARDIVRKIQEERKKIGTSLSEKV